MKVLVFKSITFLSLYPVILAFPLPPAVVSGKSIFSSETAVSFLYLCIFLFYVGNRYII